MVFTTSTNGTSATTARKRSGRRLVDRAHQQPARAAAADRQPVGRGEALGDQVLRRRDEVGEGVPLVEQLPALVPGPPHLLAAAHVRDRDDEAAVEQAQAAGRERRIEAHPVGAVAVEQQRARAVRRSSGSW